MRESCMLNKAMWQDVCPVMKDHNIMFKCLLLISSNELVIEIPHV